MPRWAAVLLCLVLFAAAMLAVRAVLHATVPGVVESASAQIGAPAVLAIVLAFGAAAGLYGFIGYRRERRQGSASRR